MKENIDEINISNNNINTPNIKDINKNEQRKSKLHEKLRHNQNIEDDYDNKNDNNDEEFSSVDYDLGKNIYRYNVILVGDCSVGKTSIINRFIDNRFNRNLKNTINIEFRIKSIKYDSNTVIDLKIWDTCGEEKFHSITKNFYHDADGIFIIFDLSNIKSFNNIKLFLKDINDVCNMNNKTIMIIGNKNDIPIIEQKVKDKDINKLIEKYNEIKYLDVSARSGNNIGEMFFQMCKLLLMNKNKILENEEEDTSSENNFKIGKLSKTNTKNGNLKTEEQIQKEKCC